MRTFSIVIIAAIILCAAAWPARPAAAGPPGALAIVVDCTAAQEPR